MSTFEERPPTQDETLGMTWWNSLSEENRSAWAAKAGTGVVADAWAAFKSSVDAEILQVGTNPREMHHFMARAMSVGRKRGNQ